MRSLRVAEGDELGQFLLPGEAGSLHLSGKERLIGKILGMATHHAEVIDRSSTEIPQLFGKHLGGGFEQLLILLPRLAVTDDGEPDGH